MLHSVNHAMFFFKVKDKELELERIRGEQEQKLRDVENELNQKLKDLEEEAYEQEERNKKELEQAVNKDRFNELEDAIHQKTMGKSDNCLYLITKFIEKLPSFSLHLFLFS
jgi:Skp family chaperone for outer membrane proteins